MSIISTKQNSLSSPWLRVTKDAPCPICGKPDWCLVSTDGTAVICPRVESDKRSGEAGWYHKLGDHIATQITPVAKRAVRTKSGDFPLASIERRHLIYSTLLATLNLSAGHRNGLVSRGLPSDIIADNAYKTLPGTDRRCLVDRVKVAGKVAGVPGFFKCSDDNGGYPDLTGAPGMLIPIRNLEQAIVGLQIRRDKHDEGGKYVWLSSSGKKCGSSSGSPAHLAYPAGIKTADTVFITEGALKADIIAYFLGCPVVGVAGVTGWRKAVDMVVKLLPRHVVLAFDNDRYINDVVKRSANELEASLLHHHFNTYEAQWPQEFKGIDDFLVAQGEATSAELKLKIIKTAQVAPFSSVSSYKESLTKSNNYEWHHIIELKHLATHIVAPDCWPPFAFPDCSCSYCVAVNEFFSGNGDKGAGFSKIATNVQEAFPENSKKVPPEFDDHADLREFHDTLARQKGTYLGLGDEDQLCGRWALVKSCDNGHYILKRVVCGREWCPYCGKTHSEHHNRRIARLVPRVFAMASVGYFVFEIPVVLRDRFRELEKLREARRYLHRLIKREFNTRGVSRWHFYGEPAVLGEGGEIVELGDYKPHLNLLIERAFTGKKQLKRVRGLWSQWVYRACGKAYYKTAPVYYKYHKEPGKKWHLVDYVSRPTFRALNDDNRAIAEALFSFNNTSWVGKFSEADKAKGRELFEAWRAKLPASKKRSIVEIEAFENFNTGKCPICGAPLKDEGIALAYKYDIIREFGGGLYEVRAPPWSWVYDLDTGIFESTEGVRNG